MSTETSHHLAVFIGELPVQGIAYLPDGYDIGVTMTEPFPGYHTGSHLMHMARPYRPRYTMSKGLERARGMLQELYAEACIFEDNRQWFEQRYAAFIANNPKPKKDPTLRQRFKSGEFPQRDYQWFKKAEEQRSIDWNRQSLQVIEH